jgi:hypothetical protein
MLLKLKQKHLAEAASLSAATKLADGRDPDVADAACDTDIAAVPGPLPSPSLVTTGVSNPFLCRDIGGLPPGPILGAAESTSTPPAQTEPIVPLAQTEPNPPPAQTEPIVPLAQTEPNPPPAQTEPTAPAANSAPVVTVADASPMVVTAPEVIPPAENQVVRLWQHHPPLLHCQSARKSSWRKGASLDHPAQAQASHRPNLPTRSMALTERTWMQC